MDWMYCILLSTVVLGSVLADKPVLRPGVDTVDKTQNDSYAVICNSTGSRTWTGPNGKSITATTGRVHVENKGTLGLALLFDHIAVSDKGIYTCTSASKEKTSFQLKVIRPPQFVNTPKEHSVNEFQSTIIRCEVEGEPVPTITWQRNGQSIDGSTYPNYVTDSKGLRVKNVTKSDSGVFTCTALQVGDADGFIRTIDITLKVHHKPEWKDSVTGNTIVYGYLGGETNITCEASAQPEAVYTWLRHNKDVRGLRLNVTEIVEPGRSVLQIKVQDESIFGHYQCQAKNKLGSISRMFDLQKGEKPDPPQSIRVGDVGVHTAGLYLEGGGGGPENVLGYRVQFVITPPGEEVSWDRPEYQDVVKTDNGQFVVKDLLEYTPYTVRAAARGPAGLSDYSNITLTLRTLRTGEGPNSADTATMSALVALFTLAILTLTH